MDDLLSEFTGGCCCLYMDLYHNCFTPLSSPPSINFKFIQEILLARGVEVVAWQGLLRHENKAPDGGLLLTSHLCSSVLCLGSPSGGTAMLGEQRGLPEQELGNREGMD